MCVCVCTGSCTSNRSQPTSQWWLHISSIWPIRCEQLLFLSHQIKTWFVLLLHFETSGTGDKKKKVSQDRGGGGPGSEPVGTPGPLPGSAVVSCWRPPERLLQQTVGPSAGSSWTVHCGIQTLSHSSPQSCRVWSDLCSHTPAHCSLLQTASYLWRKKKRNYKKERTINSIWFYGRSSYSETDVNMQETNTGTRGWGKIGWMIK